MARNVYFFEKKLYLNNHEIEKTSFTSCMSGINAFININAETVMIIYFKLVYYIFRKCRLTSRHEGSVFHNKKSAPPSVQS